MVKCGRELERGEGTGRGGFDVRCFDDEEKEFAVVFGSPGSWHCLRSEGEARKFDRGEVRCDC